MARKAFITVSFRLRKPTRKKQAVLDYVFQAYTREAQRLLDWCELHLTDIREHGCNDKGEYTADTIRPCLPSNTEWQVPVSSSLKDGLFNDVCSMVASFLSLEKTEIVNMWPTAEVVVTDESRLVALSELGSLETIGKVGALRSAEDIAETAIQVDRLSNLDYINELAADAGRWPFVKVRPLTYTRGRDFDLLITSDLQHPYVFLPLLPNKNSMIEPVDFGQKNMLTLWSNDPSGLTPIQAGKKKNGLLLPLELGKRGGKFHWQYRKFIMAMLDGNAVPKAAKVISRKGNYYINVSVAFDVDDPYEPQAYIGITDNVLYNLTYAVISKQGAVVKESQSETGILDLKMDVRKQIQRKNQLARQVTYLDYKRKAQEELLHRLINQMLAVAQHYKAAVMLMESDGIYGVRAAGKMKRLWAKAEFIIAYKCKMLGIPFRKGVFSARVHAICIRCGEDCARQEANAVCQSCGAIVPIGITKAVNIARRALYKKSEWENKGGYRGFHKRFR